MIFWGFLPQRNHTFLKRLEASIVIKINIFIIIIITIIILFENEQDVYECIFIEAF